jgi:anti-anti-sigma factor
MDLHTVEGDDRVTFLVSGELTGIESIMLTNRIEAAAFTTCSTVVVSMVGVTFIESTALGGLIYCQKYLQKRGKILQLADTFEHAHDLFRGCPLEKVLPVVDPPAVGTSGA